MLIRFLKWPAYLLSRWFVLEKIVMDPGARMVRLCVWGEHNFRWFARLDCWSWGWRVTRRPKKKPAEHKMDALPGDRASVPAELQDWFVSAAAQMVEGRTPPKPPKVYRSWLKAQEAKSQSKPDRPKSKSPWWR